MKTLSKREISYAKKISKKAKIIKKIYSKKQLNKNSENNVALDIKKLLIETENSFFVIKKSKSKIRNIN